MISYSEKNFKWPLIYENGNNFISQNLFTFCVRLQYLIKVLNDNIAEQLSSFALML
jgi:hypothetical protein